MYPLASCFEPRGSRTRGSGDLLHRFGLRHLTINACRGMKPTAGGAGTLAGEKPKPSRLGPIYAL